MVAYVTGINRLNPNINSLWMLSHVFFLKSLYHLNTSTYLKYYNMKIIS